MKIQRLFLRNVRNIKSLDLDFRDPVTGKTMSRIVERTYTPDYAGDLFYWRRFCIENYLLESI